MSDAVLHTTIIICGSLGRQYSLKLTSSMLSLSYSTVFDPKFKSSFDHKPNQIPLLGIRIQPDLQAVGFKKRNALQHLIPATHS